MTSVSDERLLRRHVEFLTIGGSIGAGLFLGSGTGIHHAGPGLVIAYVFVFSATFFAVVAVIARGRLRQTLTPRNAGMPS